SAIASSYLPWRSRSSADINSEEGAWVETGEADIESCASCPGQIIATRRKANSDLGASIKEPPRRVCRRLEHKKEGVLEDSLLEDILVRVLEVEPQCKLDLPHRGTKFKSGDLAVIGTVAIDTVRGRFINWVV